jgi:hypothetical protein
MAGQIISRGERTHLVRLYVGRDPQTGKRKYEGHTVHGTKKDAPAYLNGKLRERDLGMYASVQSVTIGVLLDDLLADYKMGKRYDWAGLVVRVHLRPFFGGMKVTSLGTDTVRKYTEKRQQPEKRTYADAVGGKKRERVYGPASNGTINRELALLRRTFNLAKQATPPKVGTVRSFPCWPRTTCARDSSSTTCSWRYCAPYPRRSVPWSGLPITRADERAKSWRSGGRRSI